MCVHVHMSHVLEMPLRLLLPLFLGLLQVSICSQWPEDLNNVRSPHPMLFFSLKDIPSMRERAATTHKAIAQQMVEAVEMMKSDISSYLPPSDQANFSSAWNEGYGNNLCALAMYCVLFPDDKSALELAHEYMERMATYQSWEYRSMLNDEMPISHSLVGMATAFDFLYPTLSPKQREKYFMRIRKTTSRHFERLKRATWGLYHIQNHVLNNCVALFIGALVTNVHDKRADLWAQLVMGHLNVTLGLLNLIVDGSLDEGVAYSTYTSRSLTMFLYLVQKHFGTNLLGNYWLKQHFWFLYRSMLPGYQETVGIADSNTHWFYGLGSMLVFLDKYVMRNGNGNWLAARVRPRPNPSKSQRWSTYHTEFIWYDESLGEKVVEEGSEPRLTCFSDWGVVTYGGGAPDATTSFLSFKAGMLHGRAINAVVKEQLFLNQINGWDSFNPGHEHPDQNSFTFWPRGRPFITEAYYGPKFSFLNNVLMFGPSPTAKCFPPYEGQIGECYRWFDWQSPEAALTSADIVAAHEEENFVFISGEAVGAYRAEMLLKSVYRALLLLTPDVLLVVDHIHLNPASGLKAVNAFFNMREGALALEENLKSFNQEAVLERNDSEVCHIVWRGSDNTQTGMSASLMGYEYPCEFNTRRTQVLNVSVDLTLPITRVAYLLFCGSVDVRMPVFRQMDEIGVSLDVHLDGVKYDVSIATAHTSPRSRVQWLGHAGFATLTLSGANHIKFGIKPPEHGQNYMSDDVVPRIFVASMIGAGGDVVIKMINKTSDFVVLRYPSKELAWPIRQQVNMKMFNDPCLYSEQHLPNLTSWFKDVYFAPRQTLLGYAKGSVLQALNTRPHAEVVLYCIDGRMNSKLAVLSQLQQNVKVIYVVRDPRSWVASAIKHGIYNKILKIVRESVMSISCPIETLPHWYRKMRDEAAKDTGIDPILLLTYYWAANMELVQEFEQLFGKHRWLTLRIEDLVSKPDATASALFGQFLKMPFPLSSYHHLMQLTRSQLHKLMLGEVIVHDKQEPWRDILDEGALKTIEGVTRTLLGPLGYSIL